ncbi:MAG: DUF4203 domain-containing protein [Archaeoglobaceae archaeon]
MLQEISKFLTPHIAVVVLVAIGLLLCFAGYRIFKFYIAFIGFIIGFILSHYFSPYIEVPFLPFIMGVIFAIVFWKIYRAGLFITGALAGYMLSDSLLPGKFIYAYSLAGFFGILILFLEKFLVILITAFLGSTAIVLATYLVITGDLYILFAVDPKILLSVAFSSPLLFLLWLVLGVIGIASQLVLAKEEEE